MSVLHLIRNWFKASIKLRILTVIGSVVSALMIVISIMILLQWRSLIIEQQESNAKSVTRAFSIPVIETLIHAGRHGRIQEDLLENHIRNFMEHVPEIVYISIQDNSHRIIAHSNLALYNTIVPEDSRITANGTGRPLTSIFPDETHGWILETRLPLQIGEKRWGLVHIGFEAASTREKIGRAFFQLLFLTVAALAVTLGLLYFFITRVTASLRELVSEVDKIDLESDDPISLEPRTDEIGFLIEHFQMLKTRLLQSRSELERAQRQIYQAEKLASIGRLASGVAHEVNNPLNGMRFCVFSIRKDPDNRAQTEEYLNLINEGLDQIESIVTKLLGYARQRPESPEAVHLGKHIRIVLDLLEYRITQQKIRLELREDPDLPAIQADPHLIQEMLMNLLLNSLDAVQEEGVITITTGKAAENKIFLRIHDNGCGIEAKDYSVIFEPFYSTKETGKGTGLGLSVTHGIVQSHKGTITVKSEPGSWSEFTITLPIEASHEGTDR